MAILVLGGAGYIGSHLVRELISAGRDVVVADNLATGFQQAVHPKARFYRTDIRDRAGLDHLFQREQIEGVIHFAAYSQVGESMQNPLKYYNNNLGGTITLLESMIAHDVKRIVFSSTAAVYGIPDRCPIPESDRTEPINPYGETKLAMEKLMRWADSSNQLKYVALRYFNAAGADLSGEIGEAHDPETHLIPLILQVSNGQREKILIFGSNYPTRDGTCVRDYVHVTDLAQGHILALDYLMNGGESDVFNLGNGVGFTVKEIIDIARKITGHPIPAEIAPKRDGDPAELVASSEKARTVLGWKPKLCDIETIVSSAWKWHQSHPDGYGLK